MQKWQSKGSSNGVQIDTQISLNNKRQWRTVKLIRQSTQTQFGFSIRGGYEHSTAFGYPVGFYITNIKSNSPADKAGLEINDQIIAINGKNLARTTSTEFVNLLVGKKSIMFAVITGSPTAISIKNNPSNIRKPRIISPDLRPIREFTSNDHLISPYSTLSIPKQPNYPAPTPPLRVSQNEQPKRKSRIPQSTKSLTHIESELERKLRLQREKHTELD